MEIIPNTCFQNIKKYWKKRSYQRLHNDETLTKRKLKVARFGTKTRCVLKINKVPKPELRLISPSKLISKFHLAYVNGMTKLNGGKNTGTPRVDEVVDGDLLVEIYKRLVASRELAAS